MEWVMLAVFLGLIPGAIARSKGRDFVVWWVYGALLFIVALPHSLMLEKREFSEKDARKCPFCAEIVKREAVICRYCGRDLEPIPAASIQPEYVPPALTEAEIEQRRRRRIPILLAVILGCIVLVALSLMKK